MTQPFNINEQLNANEQHRTREILAGICMWTAAIIVSAMFCWIIIDIVRHGMQYISWAFLFDAPHDAGRAGGIAPIIVSTLLVIAVCMAVALPIGIGSAILLSEYNAFYTAGNNRFRRFVSRSLDVLAAVPSIVFGLFGSVFFCDYLGMGFSILSGGLTLACMVLPIFIRTAEEGFRALPDDYRLAAASLGMSRSSTLLKVLLPAAIPSLLTGFVLGLGRAMAETAALIYTSGYVDRMPESIFDSGRVLSVHIYDLAMNVPGGNNNAYATAIVLLVLLFIINVLTSCFVRYVSLEKAGRCTQNDSL